MAKVNDGAVPLMEVWRGGLLECVHEGHAVICDAKGIVAAWGNPDAVIYPRSSAKMLQALPLIETGAADARGLSQAHLALACASHRGAHVHVDMAGRWIADLGLSEADLRCGAHEPGDLTERDRLIRAGEKPCQLHNNCSGKHSGFLTVTQHLKAGPEYIEIDHPLQKAIRAATEEVTEETVRAGASTAVRPRTSRCPWALWPAAWRNSPRRVKATVRARMRWSSSPARWRRIRTSSRARGRPAPN
jgi:L-asparaginase II